MSSQRKWLLGSLVAIVAMGGWASAQPTTDTGELEKRYQEKISKDFMNKISWHQKLDEALAASKARKLPVLGYFTRSYSP